MDLYLLVFILIASSVIEQIPLALKYDALGKTLQLRRLLLRAGQLMVDSDDVPDYGLAVDYSIKTGILGAGH